MSLLTKSSSTYLNARAARSLTVRTMATVSNHILAKQAATMPPGYKAKVGSLETFNVPDRVTGSAGDMAMGKALVAAWRRDGILQISSEHHILHLFPDKTQDMVIADPKRVCRSEEGPT